MEIIAHFVWAKVDRRGPDECWPWLGGYNKRGGHGVAYVGNGKSMSAHKAVYTLMVAPVPPGLVLDHVVCQNPICVNPAHCEPVTQQVNVQRGRVGAANKARCAAITHCPQGHEYTPENTKMGKLKNGHMARQCRECGRIRTRAWVARRKAQQQG